MREGIPVVYNHRDFFVIEMKKGMKYNIFVMIDKVD